MLKNFGNIMANNIGANATKWIQTGLALTIAVMFTLQAATAGQPPVPLGSTATFAVLAATTVTSSGATTVNGDLGVSPGNGLTGAPTVNGTTHLGDPTAAQAQADLTIAYNNAAGRLGGGDVSGNLGGLSFTPGLYKSMSFLEISSGNLTLDAQGDANGVFVFQIASTLITTGPRQVILIGGARACNVFWQVGSSATLGGGTVFKGNILAYTSITLNSGAMLEGRALAQNGAVSLDANTVTIPSCPTVVLLSAAVITGPYTDALSQSLNLTTKTLTVPLSGSTQFYRIRAATALTITGITLSGGNVLITYN